MTVAGTRQPVSVGHPLRLDSATHSFVMGLAAEARVKPVILDAMHRMGLHDVEDTSLRVVAALAEGRRVWMTSDLHFGHANILTYAARHHRDVAQMNADLLAMLRKQVGPDDLRVIAGDLMFGEDPAVLNTLATLSASLILVAGKHDFDKTGHFRWSWRCFSAVVPFLYWHWTGQYCLVTHLPVLVPVPVQGLDVTREGKDALREGPRFSNPSQGLAQVVNYHGHLHLQTVPVERPERIVHVNVGYDHLRGMLCL